MTANELRLGNYVISKELNNTEWPVIAISQNDIVVDKFAGHSSSFEPIPLTEEWLLNLDYYLNNTTTVKTCWSDEPYWTKYYSNDNWNISGVEVRQDGRIYCNGVLIEYVHQLQNLYFALTGKELTIKQPELVS